MNKERIKVYFIAFVAVLPFVYILGMMLWILLFKLIPFVFYLKGFTLNYIWYIITLVLSGIFAKALSDEFLRIKERKINKDKENNND